MRHISKRAAVNIEPALTRIQKLVSDRLKQMAVNIAAYPAATQQAGIQAETKAAIVDVIKTLTLEIRNVERTLNVDTKTDSTKSNVQNPFNTAPPPGQIPAPGSV